MKKIVAKRHRRPHTRQATVSCAWIRQQMSDVVSLREKVAQAELQAPRGPAGERSLTAAVSTNGNARRVIENKSTAAGVDR